ncbi:MAG: ELM1/GtrOC1 family putative glycosyltransferase [Sphingomicrobium sp.]
MSDRQPRIWALLGHRKGDNNQVLALAQGISLPFETRSMGYNLLRKLDNRLLGRRLISVVPSARKWLEPPWPDLVIGVGNRSVPVVRYIRHASGGKTKLVQLGNPRTDARHFDLVITMPQYGIPESDRVLRLPLAMGSPHPALEPSDEERTILGALPRPHRLLVIGGPTRNWVVSPEDAANATHALVRRCDQDGGTAIAIGSPRTEADVLAAVKQAIRGGRHLMIAGPVPRYAALIDDADEIHVTADSVSMLSEAVFSGKPVGMIPIRMSPRGRWHYRLSEAGLLGPPFRDLRKVWDRLLGDNLVGTIDAPAAGTVADPIAVASNAVRHLLRLSARLGES